MKAIMPVHLYGQIADMDAIGDIASRHNLRIIEDAAQAVVARDAAGRVAGAIGDVGCLSFYPTKNLSAMGDAGACLTNDDGLADRLRELRNHGQKSDDYRHESVGGNFRLDALQAAVLELKLARLPAWNERRRQLAARYDDALADTAIAAPPAVNGEHVYHQYTVRVPDGRREALRRHLVQRDIGCRVYYPLPLHLQPCFAAMGHKPGDFPAAERAADEVLSLPIYPELTDAMQDRVIQALRAF
jgi:dTDP-4-amino-4,6-dideoxygalactose transaminase